MSDLPATITIKLYPFEYAILYEFLQHTEYNVSHLRLNSPINHMVLALYFEKKKNTIKNNALSKYKKPRSLTLKPTEAVALYHELRPIASINRVYRILLGHLDRALINAGMNNTINL